MTRLKLGPPPVPIYVRLPGALVDALKRHAIDSGHSMAEVVHDAIDIYMAAVRDDAERRRREAAQIESILAVPHDIGRHQGGK